MKQDTKTNDTDTSICQQRTCKGYKEDDLSLTLRSVQRTFKSREDIINELVDFRLGSLWNCGLELSLRHFIKISHVL